MHRRRFTHPLIMADINQPNGARERVFQALYFRAVYVYANLVSVTTRRICECALLLMALGFMMLLSYAHFTFHHKPPSCLEHVRPIWPRNGILHVQVNVGMGSFVSQVNMNEAEQLVASICTVPKSQYCYCERTNPFLDVSLTTITKQSCNAESYSTVSNHDPVHNYVPYSNEFFFRTGFGYGEDGPSFDVYNADEWVDGPICAVEYALEYGLLRLSEASRTRLKIPIMYVSLDPSEDACFGKSVDKILTEYVLGYDLVVMSSIKALANDYDEKGYLRNLITGEQYRFMSVWMSRTSYITAFFIMIAFTFSISAVLRFSNQQVFMLIVHLFQVFELNGIVTLPLSHMISLILGLVGVEAVMAEFFNDANTAFFIILIVWLADQYNTICCNSTVGRFLWLKFFYLYHYFFYAYYYRFNGQFSYLSLLTCWTLTLHSMLYFFHHFELPLIARRFHVRNVVTQIDANATTFEPSHRIRIQLSRERLTTTTTTNQQSSSPDHEPTVSAAETPQVATMGGPENDGESRRDDGDEDDGDDAEVIDVLRVLARVDDV